MTFHRPRLVVHGFLGHVGGRDRYLVGHVGFLVGVQEVRV
jgi:hypothetical protein